MLTDTHAHLNDEAFDEDRGAVIERISESLKWIINNGYDLKSCRDSINLAKSYSFIYAAVGMHPHDSKSYDESFELELSEMLKAEKTVALGEIGLDYYYDNSDREVQKAVFIRQLKLAESFDKPVTIHSREASQDTLDILKEHMSCRRGAVLHSFSQSAEMLKLYLGMNVYFSISGTVTFKNADKLREVVKQIPLERIFIETDCPYLTPVPFRGKRNDSSLVEYTARTVAELKGIAFEELCDITASNAETFFDLPH